MFGKGALIVVMGFSIIFAVYQLNLRQARISTSDDINLQYTRMRVHETAISAMNIGINKIWNEDWTSGNFTFTAQGCTAVCSVSQPGSDTVYVLAKAWGYVFDENTYQQSGQSLKVEDSIRAVLAYNIPACRYFWFTDDEGGAGKSWNQWLTTDTVYGPVHSNEVINITNSPIFYDKVTAYGGITPNPLSTGSQARFYGGWEIGMDIHIPTDMTALIAAADAGNSGAPNNTRSIYTLETIFEFLSDGRVIRTVPGNPVDTVLVSDIAPTGVIRTTEDVHVKGVFNGQLTIYSEDDIYIDDDLTYASDPLTNPGSDDFLGLVAEKHIRVTDNAANNTTVTVQACLLAIQKKFEAEHSNSRSPAGELRVIGSIVQNDRGKIGVYDWSTNTLAHGFRRNYRYDTRLSNAAPPYFPTISHLRLLSWWE